jgi:hypothetical protein
MKLEEIEKFVSLIENTKDEETKSILRRLLESEIKKSQKLREEYIACSSKNPDSMCDSCDCWKHTREMCS